MSVNGDMRHALAETGWPVAAGGGFTITLRASDLASDESLSIVMTMAIQLDQLDADA